MLQRFATGYGTVTALILGLSAGAMWAEAVVLVNYWQAISPADFLLWYHAHHAILVAYYSPLQITATLFAIALPVVLRGANSRWNPTAVATAGFALAVIVLFFVFFKSANAAFLADAADLPARIPEMLQTWSNWQWFRTALGVIAAGFGILAVHK